MESINRRDLLKLGGTVVAAAAMPISPEPAAAQTPKRGGVFRVRGEDPVGFDPHLTVAFKTMMSLSFTHSRLVKVRAGSAVPPGTLPLEPDLAESWTHPNETTYAFTLRKGVRWHPKPPVNGRELTAEDVKYTYWLDAVQVTLRNWKSAGIEIDLKLKEYGAYISTTIFGKFERMANGLFGLWLVPDSYLYNYYMPGQILNASGVNDPKVADMIRLQRRTFDVRKRREIIYDIQRYCAQQASQLYGPSVNAVAAWEPYVRNFAPNIGFDYGGRLMVAWLDHGSAR